MDFTELISIAQKNEKQYKPSHGGYKTELSAPKREKSEKPKSEVVQKLIEEKRREKELEERRKRGDSSSKHREQESRQNDSNKKFKIPKKQEKIQELLKDLESDSDNIASDDSDRKDSVARKQHDNDSINRDKHKERKHDNYKSSKHKTDHSEHKSEKHKNHSRDGSEKSGNHSSKSDKHKHESKDHKKSDREKSGHSNHHSSHSSDHSHRHNHSKESSHSHSREREKHSGSSSSRHSDKSSKESNEKSHSSSSSKIHKEHGDGLKTSKKDLSLDELRRQVQEMKAMEAKMAKEEEMEKKREIEVVKPSADPQKNKQGVSMNDADAKKASILMRTQMILERTKARLAEERQGIKQQRQRGKRLNDKERVASKEGDKIKSRSLVKDDDSDFDDESAPLDTSMNQDLLKVESGDILKNIKKKIDEKLGNYNFPEKELKEKQVKKRSPEKRKDLNRVKDRTSHDRYDKLKEKEKQKNKFKDKREKIKEMMRKDYQSNFSESADQPKSKKPVIMRRFQQQPPPLNFNDLLKIAETKCKESAPEPVVKPVKKVQERPLTQEEIDRRKRAEEVKRRRMEEEKAFKEGGNKDQDGKTDSRNTSALKAKSDSNLLRGALTGKPGRESPVARSSQSNINAKQNIQAGKKKYDVENDNILVCKPSSSTAKPARAPPENDGLNPWDRIYGQIKKNNPKPEKRKRPVLDSSEEEDEYDEDDDFIDDDDGAEDYSAHIRDIFGYDKSKYRYEDEDDVDNMEANFTTIMKEEARSAKIGKMEDLEDMRREEEELKRLKAKKKMRR